VDETGQEIKPIDRAAAKSPSEHLAGIESGANTQGAYTNVDKVHDENRQISSRPWYLDPESSQFKMVLLALALVVVVLTFSSSFLENAGEVTSGELAPHLAKLETEGLPTWALWVKRGMEVLLSAAAVFVTLYATLAIVNRLPGDGFRENLIMLLVPVLIIWGVELVGMAIGMVWFLAPIGIIMFLVQIVVTLWVLSEMLSVGVKGWILYFVIDAVFGLVMFAIRVLLVGGLAHLAGLLA